MRLDGKSIQIYEGHNRNVTCLTTWNDALFSGSIDNTIIQWTGKKMLTYELTCSEPSIWSKKNHRMFKESSQREIKEVVLLSMKRNGCLLTLLPLDIIWILCQFIPSSQLKEDEEMKVIYFYAPFFFDDEGTK